MSNFRGTAGAGVAKKKGFGAEERFWRITALADGRRSPLLSPPRAECYLLRSIFEGMR